MIGNGRFVFESSHAVFSASPCNGLRMMIMSKYELNVRRESSRDSPFISLEIDGSRTSAIRKPSIWQAA